MLDLPLEYALIGFADAKPTGKIVPELLDLAERGIVRFVDIVFIYKDEDGVITTLELNDLEPELYEMFVPMGEHVSSLFTTDDLAIAASKLAGNSAALLLLWENLWVADLRQAIVDSGGQLVERAQIAPEVVEQFVQALAAEGAEQEVAIIEEDRIRPDLSAGLALEIPRDLSAALAVGPIPRGLLAASVVGRIRRDRSVVSAVGQIPQAQSAVSASDAATASGCCASRVDSARHQAFPDV